MMKEMIPSIIGEQHTLALQNTIRSGRRWELRMQCCASVVNAVMSDVTSRGSALQKRLRDREKEMEADERDRKREKEELEEIRRRLLDEGHPNPDAELRRVRSSFIVLCVCENLQSGCITSF